MSNVLAKFHNDNYSAHAGHAGRGGVQNHSVGSYYPVLSYRIGDDLVAEFHGQQRRADGNGPAARDGHKRSLDILKCAERVTDAIYSDRAGGSVWLNCADDPTSGYCVSLYGHETRYSPADCIDGEYGTVYADVVEKLEWINGNGWFDVDHCIVAIGWWEDDGILYVDVSVHRDDADDAFDLAHSDAQIGYYDIANQSTIYVADVVAGKCNRDGRTIPAGPAKFPEAGDLNVCTFRAYRVDASKRYGYVGSFDDVKVTVYAASKVHAGFVAKEYVAINGNGSSDYMEFDEAIELTGFTVNAERAGCIHFEDLTE